MEIKHFHGLSPRVPDENLLVNYATQAIDVDLRHGTLKPWRTSKRIKEVPHNTLSIYQNNCCWLAFSTCVDTAEWTAQCPRLYVTGEAEYPTVRQLNADCTFGPRGVTRLGVPAPVGALYARALPASKPTNKTHIPDAQERESRSYVYTYVNYLGEEGPPSYPTTPIDTDDGNPVTLTGFAKPPVEYGITHVKIYRQVTAYRSEMSVQQGMIAPQTDYFHVATVPVGLATHVDGGLNVDKLGEALTTLDVLEPPADLRGISSIPNTRLLAGFSGNTLCFSMNNQPWNWPLSQRYELDDNIIAIKPYKGRLFVLTDGHPYTVDVGDGVESRACRSIIRHDTPMPMVTCASGSGAIATPAGVFYVSDRGLVAMGDAEPIVVTTSWFSVDDWRTLQPHSMRLGWHDGCLFITSAVDTFILQLETNVERSEYSRLTSLSIRPQQYFTSRHGELFYLLNGGIYHWQAGTERMPFYWKSGVFDTKQFNSVGAVRLWGSGSTSMELFVEGRNVFGPFLIQPNTAHRLPRYGHHLHHQVAFSGVQEVVSVEMAHSRRELSTT